MNFRLSVALGTAVAAALLSCSDTSEPKPATPTLVDGGAAGDAALQGDAATPDAAIAVEPGVYRLDGLDLALPTADLAPLASIIGNADVIGLGEANHSSAGFYRAKSRLIRRLIETENVRVIGLEANWYASLAIDPALTVCPPDGVDKVVTSGAIGPERVYLTREMSGLLKFICEWNTAHPSDHVHFVGLDVRQPWEDSPHLRAFLESVDAAGTATLRDDLLACVPRGTTTYSAYIGLFAGGEKHKLENHNLCLTALDAVEKRFVTSRQAWESATSADAVEIARLHARSLRAVENQVSLFPGNVDGIVGASFHASMEARAIGLTDIVRGLLPLRFPKARAALWMANLHVQYALDAATGPAEGGAIDLGSRLRASLGDRYRAIAVTARTSHVQLPSGQLGNLTAGPNSIEVSLLSGLGPGPWLIDIAKTSRVKPGKTYELGGFSEVVADQFHGLLVMEDSPLAEFLPF